jgi:hypothetical protein
VFFTVAAFSMLATMWIIFALKWLEFNPWPKRIWQGLVKWLVLKKVMPYSESIDLNTKDALKIDPMLIV